MYCKNQTKPKTLPVKAYLKQKCCNIFSENMQSGKFIFIACYSSQRGPPTNFMQQKKISNQLTKKSIHVSLYAAINTCYVTQENVGTCKQMLWKKTHAKDIEGVYWDSRLNGSLLQPFPACLQWTEFNLDWSGHTCSPLAAVQLMDSTTFQAPSVHQEDGKNWHKSPNRILLCLSRPQHAGYFHIFKTTGRPCKGPRAHLTESCGYCRMGPGQSAVSETGAAWPAILRALIWASRNLHYSASSLLSTPF